MPALSLIFNSAYYANNCAGIFDAGLRLIARVEPDPNPNWSTTGAATES